MKRRLVISAVMGVLVLGVSSAWAIPPDQGEYPLDFTDAFLGDCGDDFYICESGVGTVDWKLFFFNNGDPKRYVEKVKFYGMINECGNLDNALPYIPLSYTFGFDVGGPFFIHGLFAMINLPGYGQIFRDVGNLVYEFDNGDLIILFEAGEHQWWNEDFDAVCDFLMNGD